MKRLTLITCIALLPFSPGVADESSKSLASTLEVYVFPAAGQASDQQSKDEGECYNWAVSNTGSDPFELQKQDAAVTAQAEQQVAQTQSATQGAGAKGAVKGAAAGALIGEVSGGDVSDSAAIGAAAGVVSSRRRGRAANQQTQQQAAQAEATSHQATEEKLGNFKKAFGVCLEAKEYMVK
jgi:hypothetical protein